MGRKEGCCATMACIEAYLPTKWHLDPSSRLATTDMGQKLGVTVPPFFGELHPHLTQCGWGQGLHPCQVSPPVVFLEQVDEGNQWETANPASSGKVALKIAGKRLVKWR